jgi:hypothetical protein
MILIDEPFGSLDHVGGAIGMLQTESLGQFYQRPRWCSDDKNKPTNLVPPLGYDIRNTLQPLRHTPPRLLLGERQQLSYRSGIRQNSISTSGILANPTTSGIQCCIPQHRLGLVVLTHAWA